ncbi:MAG: hypothetical protein K0S80_4822 [Neobacillus sp.]|jgi:peptidoglycan hydrolase-like protein with peptidoglycan-binding domain|nr:hypothetical protein [Neobacillus sp.]
MDEMVLTTQQWLNATYTGKHGYEAIPENGKTGWTTVYALTRALQIELGIAEPSDNFGDQTTSIFSTLVPGMEDNQIYILQGALWCKGIGPGSWSGTFDDATAESIRNFKSDAGVSSDDVSVDSAIMKALLDMSAFVLVQGGSSRIRTIQQNLNHDYLAYTGLQPCDGLYGRQTNTALIYALQAEEGLSTSVATGTFGSTTTSKCPTLQPGDSRQAFVKILQYALCVNDFYDGDFDGVYSENVTTAVSKFQSFMAIPVTGIANMTTIKGLLSSAGDTNRDALACDTATVLTASTAQAIKRAGFNYVGRYLTGTVGGTTSKALTNAELQNIFDAGLKAFTIYEDYSTGGGINYFSETQGVFDGLSAIDAASNLGIPKGTTVFFAVDVDALDEDITSNIIPYFQGVQNSFETRNYPSYRIGVYGTRNVCSKVASAGISEKSFVADMSTGWSGNLGFRMPNDWSYDQFRTITVGNSTLGYVEVDMDGYSGQDSGIDHVDDSVTTIPTDDEMDLARENAFNNFKNSIPILTSANIPAKIQMDFPYEITTGLVKVTLKLSATLEPIEQLDQVLTIKNGVIQNPFTEGITELSGKVEIPDADAYSSQMNQMASAMKSGYIIVKISYDTTANTCSVSLSCNLDSVPVNDTYKTTLSISITYTIDYNDPSLPEDVRVPDESGYINNFVLGAAVALGILGIIVVAAVLTPVDITAAIVTGIVSLFETIAAAF